jgi:zinc protease
MDRFPRRCAAFLLSVLLAAPSREPVRAASSGDDVLKATLANGLQVVIVHNALAPVVSTDLVYLAGSRDDPPEFQGMAHAQEHMMFRGTKNLNTSQLGTIASALGSRFNAETSDTITQYEFTVPASNLDAILRIESDRMTDVLDLQSQWEDERGAISQEVLRDESLPGADFFRETQAYAFAGTPYARQGVGTVAAFNRLTGPDIKKFYERWYAPNNAVLVIAGDVDKNAVLGQVRSYFEKIPKRAIPDHSAAHLEPLKRKVIRRPTTLTYPLAAVALRFPGIQSSDFIPAYLLQQVLASPRGPLQTLVDTGEALDAEWISNPYNPLGQLGMATAALPPNTDPSATTSRIESILRGVAAHGVSRELFETTKRQSIVSQELGRDSISALAGDWATTIALDGEPSIRREQQLLAAVTLADVNRAAKRYLVMDHAIIGALTPSPSASEHDGPAVAPHLGPERPLDTRGFSTELPAWGAALVDHVSVPPADTAPAQSKLPNGITLVVRQAQISDTVLAYGVVRTNPALEEPAGKEGVSAVLSEMFALGTRERDRQAFQRAQDDIDSQIGGGARFGLQTTSDSFGRAVALLGEAELQPRFDAQTFQSARRRALEQLQTSLASTASVADMRLNAELLPIGDPALRRPTPQTIAALTLDDVRAYYAKTFRPDLTTIVVVGNVAPAQASAAFEHAFGSWRASGPPPALELPQVPLNPASEVRLHVPSLNQDVVTLTELVAVEPLSSKAAAMRVGNTIFGGGSLGAEQSRLFRDIRQNAGLVYSIGSDFSPRKTRSQFEINFASTPGNRERIEKLISDEIARMQTTMAGSFELSLAKAAMVRRGLVDRASLASIGGSLLGHAEDAEPLDQDRLDAQAVVDTSAEAVKEAFASIVRPSSFVRVIVGP